MRSARYLHNDKLIPIVDQARLSPILAQSPTSRHAIHQFRIDGMALYVIATDGHPLSHPQRVTEFFVGARSKDRGDRVGRAGNIL